MPQKGAPVLSLVEPPTAESPPLRVGDVLGTYTLEALIGEGTMGQVFRARHQRLGREVALKVLHDHLLVDKALVARFLQEARLVNQINHEHIVEVHDFVEEMLPERVYGVMELLRGQTLSDRLAERPLSIEELCTIGRQVASALEAAHRVGVVHRDLKPDNIFLVSREGRPEVAKVLDFGVAKLIQRAGDLRVADTQSGAMVGTPRYMAPEQAAGLEVDARSDIYAMGTVLYEMLAEGPPFTSAVFGQLAADIITRSPPPLPAKTAAGEAVPPALRELVFACLQKQADDRPQTMAEVAAALDSVLTRPATPRRSPLPLVLLAGAAVLALGAGLWFSRPVEPSVQPVVETPRPPPEPVVVAPPPLPAAPQTVALSVVSSPPGALVTRGDTGEALGLTPLRTSLPRSEEPLTLHLELSGYQPLERTTSFNADQSLELALQPLAVKPKPRAVTDGVLDPY